MNVVIDVVSLDFNYVECDKYLCGKDFFNVFKFLNVSFKSIKVEKIGDKIVKIIGDFILKGVIKFVILDIIYIGGGDDLWGGYC